IKFFNQQGDELAATPEDLADLYNVDTANLDNRIPECGIMILCDVDNQLLGDSGAAALFGPQKGTSPDEVIKLDAFLNKFATIAQKQTGRDMAGIKHSGTAGGA